MATLYQAIMNLTREPPPAFSGSDWETKVYEAGYAAAKHDAAELALGIELPHEDDAEPITEQWLLEMGFRSTKDYGFILRDRRMILSVNTCGTIHLTFDATYSGTFATYEKFTTRGAIRRVVSMFGFLTFGTPLEGPRFTRAQRQKMHELQVEPSYK